MVVGTITGEDGKILSRYLEALARPRRRYVLYYLYEHDGGTVLELSKYVLSLEEHRPMSEVSEEECESIQTELHHNHLPRLAEDGLISYDQRTGDVRLESLPMPFLVLLWICYKFEEQG